MTGTEQRIIIGGCGALGSQIALLLAMPGRSFVLYDDDTVGEENIHTSAFWEHQVGTRKVIALAEMLYQKDCHAVPYHGTVTTSTRADFGDFGPALIVDTFDNTEARQVFTRTGFPTLHVGVSDGGTGSAIWDEAYIVPQGLPRGENPVCTHLLGRVLLQYTAVVGAAIADRWLVDRVQAARLVTATLDSWRTGKM